MLIDMGSSIVLWMAPRSQQGEGQLAVTALQLPRPHPHHGGEGHLAGRTPLVACREQHVQPGSDLKCTAPVERLSA